MPLWGAKEWALVTASGVVHVFYYIMLLRGYRKSDLTVVYPLARGSGPLLSSLVALFLLGERLTLLGALGVAAVVAGVFLIAGGPALFRAGAGPGEESARARGHRLRPRDRGVHRELYGGGRLRGEGGADVAHSGRLRRQSSCACVLLVPPLLADRATAAALWRAQWKYALLVAVLSPVSYVLVLFAMQTAPLSHVAPAREVSMLFAALIGGQLLGEGDRALRIFGAACIAFGVMALALG